jgi:hypothetical protein
MRSVALWIICALLLAGVPAGASAAPHVIAAGDAGDPVKLWRSVMTGLYGPYDRQQRCWTGSFEGDAYCMRPHTMERVSAGGRELLYLAIGGGSQAGGGCHACAGAMGLVVLEKRPDGSYAETARNSLYEAFGSWGTVPPEESFAVREVGPGRHGWVIEGGYTAQGYTVASKWVFVDQPGGVVLLGAVPVLMDECGTGKEPCQSYAFDLSFAPGARTDWFDAVLEVAPESQVPALGSRFVIPYDPAKGDYAVPEALAELLSA